MCPGGLRVWSQNVVRVLSAGASTQTLDCRNPPSHASAARRITGISARCHTWFLASFEWSWRPFLRERFGGFMEILGQVKFERLGLHPNFSGELIHVPAARAHRRAHAQRRY